MIITFFYDNGQSLRLLVGEFLININPVIWGALIV